VTAAAETPDAAGIERDGAMSHREVLESMSGLLLGLLVAILSSTVVSAALPTIIEDLHGGQSSFTWVVTATLLTMTVSTPIWGKLADLFDRKRLVQALLIFVTASALEKTPPRMPLPGPRTAIPAVAGCSWSRVSRRFRLEVVVAPGQG